MEKESVSSKPLPNSFPSMKAKDFSFTEFKYKVEGKWATLLKDLDIWVYTDKGTIHYIVKKGFRWNGNSGSFPCRFHKHNERYNISILCHDLNYHQIGLSKAEADELLCSMLQKSGYGYFFSHIIHIAVDAFARSAFGGSDKLTLDNLDLISLSINNEVLF